MVVRKYTDGDSNFEVSVTEDRKILFEIEKDGIFVSAELDHAESKDLYNQLYDFVKQIEPTKSNG